MNPGAREHAPHVFPPAVVACAGGAALFVAVLPRVVEYCHNKAIWLDEAHLAINILTRDYAGLTQRLDFGQGAPLLFLWLERSAAYLFGPGELALRLIPLMASIASCVLVFVFLRRSVPASGFWIAFLVFALSTPVVRYAAEVKPYAMDLAVSLVLYLLFLRLERKPLTVASMLTFAVVGSVGIWLAFPAVSVLGGMGTVLITHAIAKKKWRRAAGLSAVAVAWSIGFAADYWLMLRYNTQNAEVRTWWLDRFMPLPPHSLSDCYWFVRTFFEVFSQPLGLGAGGVGAVLFLVGGCALWRRNKLRLALMLAPIAFTLLASGLQVYPFMGRFLLFMVPLLLVVIGAGWNFAVARTNGRIIPAAIVIVLLVQPAAITLKGMLAPGAEGVRPAFGYLRDHWKEGDKLYVYCWAAPSFRYYELKNGVDFPDVWGQSYRADWPRYIADLAPVRGSLRAWIVLTGTPPRLAGQEEKFILAYLDSAGSRIDARRFSESSIYLYNLGVKSP